MKITKIAATPVNIPLEAPYWWSYGTLPGFTQSIVQVTTEDGLTGIGEAPGAGAARLINGAFADALVGHDALDIVGAEFKCLPSQQGVQSIVDRGVIDAFGGLEMALWDLRGKAWDQPVWKLLGGMARSEVAFSEYFAYRPKIGAVGGESTPADVADYCQRMQDEHGATVFEGKTAHCPDPKASIAMIEAIRKRLGDGVTIRIDSNHGHSLATAREIAPAFEELGVANWEDPVGTYEELARLRPHTRLRFSSHNIDLPKVVGLGVPDTLVTGIAGHGGFRATQAFVAACQAMAVDFWCYSGDSGIGSTAYLHLSAATPWIRYPSQSLFRWQPIDVIEEGPFRPKNNILPVPTGPGLGITLSPAKLAHAHELYLDQGPYNKYHDPMAPGRLRRLPLD
ncbi:MAG: chloromuconate cycloisomerase [Rhizobiales bacterium]|nr:chloromuconate cycloisomerase [Hyphomicrobiales bacterium]